MTFTVTVLGSSGRFATRERASSGYLACIDDVVLWIDAGGGTWRHLLGHVDYAELDGVLLTHRHPDHTTDLFQCYHARMYGQDEPLPPIPLWAPKETLATLATFADVAESFELTPITAGDELNLGSVRMSLFDMAHPPETLGVRIERGDGVFAYSSDTGPGAAFDGLARDADIFICEATHQDEDEHWEGHLRASDAARIASRHGVKRLVLTHLPHDRDLDTSLQQARAVAPDLAIELAEDNKTYEVVS